MHSEHSMKTNGSEVDLVVALYFVSHAAAAARCSARALCYRIPACNISKSTSYERTVETHRADESETSVTAELNNQGVYPSVV